jgi:hypothetical protein
MRIILGVAVAVAFAGQRPAMGADIPDDVRAEFSRAEKENQQQLTALKGRAKEVDGTLHAHDIGRTREQALDLIAISKKLHAEIDARTKDVPPAGLWGEGEREPDPGRIGVLNVGKLRVERVVNKNTIEAVRFAYGRPRISNLGGGGTHAGTADHDVGQPFIVGGIDASALTDGKVIEPPAGVFRVETTEYRGRTILKMSACDGAELKDAFKQLKEEANRKH